MTTTETATGIDAAKAAGVTAGTIWTGRASGHLFPVVCVAEDATGGAVVVYRLHPMHQGDGAMKCLPLTDFLTLFVRR